MDNSCVLFREWCVDSGRSKSTVPLAYFQHRIDNAKYFDPDPDTVEYQTDHYRLIRVR